MNRTLFWILLFISFSASAEVFKCVNGASVVYQAMPCSPGKNEKSLDIELTDPVGNAKALERYQDIQEEYQTMKERDAVAQQKRMDLQREQLETQNKYNHLRELQNQANPQPEPYRLWPRLYVPIQK